MKQLARINLQNTQQLIQLNTRKKNNLIKKWAEELNRYFFKGGIQMANKRKDAQHSSLLEKCKSNYKEISPHTGQNGPHLFLKSSFPVDTFAL